MLPRILALVTLVGVVTSARFARADGCAPGQVVGDDTDGHCCWPAQQWSEEYNRCTGAPQCPQGWYGSGSECVATPEAAPNPPPPIPVAPLPQEQRPLDLRPPMFAPGTELPYYGGPIPFGARVDERHKKGLIIGGFITLTAGYGVSLFGTLFIDALSAEGSNSCVGNYTLGLIPVVGAMLGGISAAASGCGGDSGSNGLLAVSGIVVSGVQIAGLAMAIYGMTHKDRFLVFDMPSADNGRGGLEIALEPGTSGAAQGLSLVARF